ncbi:MAG: hypothetical protein ACW97P_04565 [Candidatus Hodarchaeales archaeon]
MMISSVSSAESQHIIKIIIDILKSDEILNIFNNKQLIMVSDKRDDLYLIDNKDQPLIELLNTTSKDCNCFLRYIKIKMGFLIKGEFKIGIESLPLLAPYARKPFILTTKQTNLFIYGKSFPIHEKAETNETTSFKEGEMVIVFGKTMIPIGYGKIIKKANTTYLENLVDIGIYLRSEKSAF